MINRRSLSFAALLTTVAGTAPLVSDAASQTPSGTTFGLGYTANAPKAMAGGNVHVVFPVFGGLGLYVDAKFDVSSPTGEDTYISTRTASQVEDEVPGVTFMASEESWRSFNVAVTRPITPALTMYIGAGYANRKWYHEYRDPSGDLGLLGFFWVEDPEQEWDTINGLVGGFLRLSRWIDFQFGIETRPRGFTVGGSVRLPPR